MTRFYIRARRRALDAVGVPPRAGVLFGVRARRELVLVMLGLLVTTVAEVLAIASIVPLMQVLTGSPDSAAPTWLAEHLGEPFASNLPLTLAALVLLGFLFKGVVSLLIRWWTATIIFRQEVDTATGLLEYYLTAPYGLHQARHTGELIRNMNDATSSVYSTVVLGSMTVAAESLTVLGIIGLLIAIQPTATLLALGYFLLAIVVFNLLTRPRVARAGELLMSSSLNIFRAAVDALGGVREVQLRGRQHHFLDRYRREREVAFRAKRLISFLNEMPKYVLEVLFVIGIGALVIVTVPSSAEGTLTTVALFSVAGYRLLPSFVRASAALTSARSGHRAAELVVADVLAARENSANIPNEVEGFSLAREIVVDDVTFSYPGAASPAVEGVSLLLTAGSSTALVGASGSGKSTLVDLILGFQTPNVGRILADGVDVSQLGPAWKKCIGFVPQEVYLTDSEVWTNIAYGEDWDEVDQDELALAIERAQLTDFIAGLDGGVHATIGERGSHLSGGQRQRIGIARALYRQPRVLVLDEATSALDTLTERKITETVDALRGQLTLIVIAHRLSTVRNCDSVVYLDRGHVIGRGSFEDLQRTSPEFEELVRIGRLEGKPISST